MKNFKLQWKIVTFLISTIIISLISSISPLKAETKELDYSRDYLRKLSEKTKEITDEMDIRILNNKYLISLENQNGKVRYISSDGINWEKLELEYQDITYGMGKFFALDKNGVIFYSFDLNHWNKFAELDSSKKTELIPLDISIGEKEILVSHYSPKWGNRNYKNGLEVFDTEKKIWKETQGYNKDYGTTYDLIYTGEEFVLVYNNNNIFDTSAVFYTSKDGINWIIEKNKLDLLRKLNLCVNYDTNIYNTIDIIRKQISDDALNGKNIPVKVFLDDELIKFDQDALLINGRVLVPLRKIFESLGGTVIWDQKTKIINGQIGEKNIILKIGEKSAKVNGEKVFLDVPAQIINGRTLVPVRFIADCTGKKSTWDQNNYIVRIDSMR